jgi:hypothetical protein
MSITVGYSSVLTAAALLPAAIAAGMEKLEFISSLPVIRIPATVEVSDTTE